MQCKTSRWRGIGFGGSHSVNGCDGGRVGAADALVEIGVGCEVPAHRFLELHGTSSISCCVLHNSRVELGSVSRTTILPPIQLVDGYHNIRCDVVAMAALVKGGSSTQTYQNSTSLCEVTRVESCRAGRVTYMKLDVHGVLTAADR